jgi:hypothetical protein
MSFHDEVMKLLLTMVWNVAGLLVSPRYITRGSKRPQFVWNAAFHSSPPLICTLLYIVPFDIQFCEVSRTPELIDEIIYQWE